MKNSIINTSIAGRKQALFLNFENSRRIRWSKLNIQ